MAKEFSKRFYNSKHWKRCRESYINKTIDKLCERCGEPGVEVHHKIHLTPKNINDTNIKLSHNNLELLCYDCHQNEHYRKSDVKSDDVMFDGNGDLVYSPPIKQLYGQIHKTESSSFK
ncbi:HNH endonuclease [Sporanaerobium hydrogeniformans]|uniref:HNH endonuclease n=1 Tax=Sporanaerobium hydrogeniformans TaxID=3072179 RepID=A0AC61D8W9_9FIRM|nr:HNH endonuclease [Sporanaerobium hydrogeniformans]PHV69769.1 HNH endonuclease [Sporanaerobium hydrogeniformans]